MKRESFQSRLGFLLVTAGCAIGIGNVWRFPFVAGQNGGRHFCHPVSDIPAVYGSSGADDGAGRRKSKPQERGAGV